MLIGSEMPWINSQHQASCSLSGVATVAWSSKKQPIVAMFSTEAKYRGVIVATCEAISLKWLLRDLQFDVADPIPINYDNINIMQLAKNPVFHARTKRAGPERGGRNTVCLNQSIGCRYLHEGPRYGQIATLLGDAWDPTPRHAALEGESEKKTN